MNYKKPISLKTALGIFVLSTFLPEARAGSPVAYGACVAVCIPVCEIFGLSAGAAAGAAAGAIAGASAAFTSCPTGCATVCAPFAACLSSNTPIMTLEKGYSVQKTAELIKVGDLVETIIDKAVRYTEVIHNTKATGNFSFITIKARDIHNASNTRHLEVTDEHGVVIYHYDHPMTIKKASNIQIGDIFLDKNMKKLEVESFYRHNLGEKHILNTKEGTVLANDIYVTTICDNIIKEDNPLLSLTIKDWQRQHSFGNDGDSK